MNRKACPVREKKGQGAPIIRGCVRVSSLAMDTRIVPVIRGLCIALVGAGLAVWMGTPLPWLLGPLFLTAATRVAGMPTGCPAPFNKLRDRKSVV